MKTMKTMKTMMTFAVLGTALALTACGDAPQDTNEARDNMSAAMNDMPADGAMMGDDHEGMTGTMGEHMMASSTATVTAVDAKTGKVTLDHGAIAEANWPAMTMEFDAQPELLKDIAVGDKVAFDVSIKDGGGEVTAISKQ